MEWVDPMFKPYAKDDAYLQRPTYLQMIEEREDNEVRAGIRERLDLLKTATIS